MADPEYKCSTATGYRESRVKDGKIELKDTTKLENNVKSVCNSNNIRTGPLKHISSQAHYAHIKRGLASDNAGRIEIIDVDQFLCLSMWLAKALMAYRLQALAINMQTSKKKCTHGNVANLISGKPAHHLHNGRQ